MIEKETQVTLTVMAMFGAFLAFWTVVGQLCNSELCTRQLCTFI